MAANSESLRTAQSTGTSGNTGPLESVKKRTIMDPNSSYIEEEDATYSFNETTATSETTTTSDAEDVSQILHELDDAEHHPTAQDQGQEDAEHINTVQERSSSQEDMNAERINTVHQRSSSSEPISGSKKTPVQEFPSALDQAQQQTKLRRFLVKHEIIRKGLHSSIAPFTLCMYALGIHQKQFIAPLLALFAVIFANDYIRLHNPDLNERIVKTWWFLIRDNEKTSYNGVLYYLVGLVIVFCFAPKDISLMSVLLLSWADTAASTFGRLYGKYTPKIVEGKSVAGTAASTITGICSCYLIYGYVIPTLHDKVDGPGDILWTEATSKLNLHWYAALSGLVAGFSESITIFNLDDNLTIPVLSGVFLYGLVKYFQV